MTNPTPHGQVPEALIDLIDAYAETRHRCGGIYNAKTEAARKAVIEALSGVQALSAGPMVTSEQRRLIGVIAEKIEDGTLFQSGIYQKKDLARFVRNMLDVTPTAPAASPTPPAEQPIGEVVVTKDEDGQIVAVTRQDDEGRILSVIATSDTEEQQAPKAAQGVGNSGFDHKTAADLLNNKTVSDEAVRKFVAASRWAHDEKAALSAMLLSVRGVLASREAEIALLKKALMEAEAAPKQEAQADSQPGDKDLVAVPRDLIGAACSAIDKKRDGARTLAELRRYTVGDLSAAITSAPQADSQPAPATQQAVDVVAYLDVGANGYLDLGSELSEDALQQLPKGRHALIIAGTYGIDGYVTAPQPSPTTKPAPQQEAQEPVMIYHGRCTIDCGEHGHHDMEMLRMIPSGSKLYTAPQPAPAPLSEMPYEKRKAIQEGEQIGASDAWFKARHEMLDTLDRRNVFRAGFDRGWNAAIAAQGGK